MSRTETDKGWAWVIVAAVTIINVSILPIQQCFGLIFAERFSSLGITATQTSFILHLNGTIMCSLGVISGPMMKRFSFRKVAFFGGLTIILGISATAFAVSVPTIILTYCVIFGIGHGIMFPATSLAVNTYFRKKRKIATGLSVTLTGLGPILMPFLIAVLLENYGTTGTLLFLAGIAAHSIIGASLLKPFKKEEITSVVEVSDITPSSAEAEDDNDVRNENNAEVGAANGRLLNTESRDPENFENHVGESENKDESKARKRKTIFGKIAENLDLDLLKDNRFIAVVLGMALSMVAETNFNAMFPIVLAELSGLERSSIATVMSVQAAFDITGRLCVPLFAQKARWTSRNLYIISLIGSILGRTILSNWGDTYTVIIGVAMIIGVSKGTKAVFQSLIIPDYVPIERFAAASGILMVCNGILSICLGPIIGFVRDSSKSYVEALHFTSFLSLSCVLMWLVGGLWTFNGRSMCFQPKRVTNDDEPTP